MDFFIKYELNENTALRIKYCDDICDAECENGILYIEKLNHLDYVELVTENKIQIAVGDVIGVNFSTTDLKNCKGLFYLLTFSDKHQTCRIEPDEYGLLPIYFIEQENYVLVSSSYSALVSKLVHKMPNSDFYSELAILYTQLNGSTYFKEIRRMGYGDVVELSGGFEIISVNRFHKCFSESPRSFESSIKDIADKFIDITKFYLQDPCAISLTGGFDGRTITGCAHYHKSDFMNFSYGRRGNGDVDNPISIAEQLGLQYRLIELEQDYIDDGYSESVDSYIKFSGGQNGFQYPQSIYYAKLIGAERDIIITGYLGSEILANVKGADDEICPKGVLDFLKTGTINKDNYAYDLDQKLTTLGLIGNTNEITNTLEKLYIYFSSLPKHLNNNQKYACFSFENIHRNTFGIWIYNAMHYAKVRVPFIDTDFFNEISGTEVSQFYRNFLENNPIKRINGQMLYPTILNKVWPELNAIISSKGYPPSDILTVKGKIKIAMQRYFYRNVYSESHGLDRMSTKSGAVSYIEKNKSTDNQLKMYKDVMVKAMNENAFNRSLSFLALSKIRSEILLNEINN
jgi:hypothetical protein